LTGEWQAKKTTLLEVNAPFVPKGIRLMAYTVSLGQASLEPQWGHQWRLVG